MKIIKTDGRLVPLPEHLAALDGLDVEFIDRPYLTEDELVAGCKDADALMVLREPITKRVIQALSHCKIISRFGVGLDVVDVDAATVAGIQVTNVPDGNVDEVSTHAMGMILAFGRKLLAFDAAVREGCWQVREVGDGIQRPSAQTLGLVGFGRIGRLMASKARPFGYRIIACDPNVDGEVMAGFGVTRCGFDELLAQSDIVSLHVPLTPETRGMMSAQAISGMRQGALLINVSRGGLVDEAALATALKAGRLAGAGIDTFSREPVALDHPLLHAPNVLLSPHAAHYSLQSGSEILHKAFGNVAAVLRGQRPSYPVNFI